MTTISPLSAAKSLSASSAYANRQSFRMFHGHKRMPTVLEAIAGVSAGGVGSMVGYEFWQYTVEKEAMSDAQK